MKSVAKSLKDLVTEPVAARLLDRTQALKWSDIEALREHWGYDLYSRKPRPAVLSDTKLKATDLDLACFLSALSDRGAVINLPAYKSQTPKTRRSNERVISAANRHGKIVGLVANKDVFSFSARVFDQNVVRTLVDGSEETGAFRNFMLVSPAGEWSSGWRTIEFSPSAKENDFLSDRKLWTGNTVYFENFVHPLRWTAMYGAPYVLTKIAIARLEDEARHMRREIKRIIAAGVSLQLPADQLAEPPPVTTRDAGVAAKVVAFEAEIDAPWNGDYLPYAVTVAALAHLKATIHRVQYDVLPALRLATRSTEMAFMNQGASVAGFPGWIRNARWEKGFVQKGKRTLWNRLVLAHFVPFAGIALALRYRHYDKTVTASEAGAEGMV